MVIFLFVVIIDLLFPLCSGSSQYWFLVIGQHASLFPMNENRASWQIASERITYGDESSFDL